MNNKIRYNYLDQSKAFGMILIILGHISYDCGYISIWASYFKIAIFFVVSGALLLYKNELDIKRKAKSLFIPYFFYSFLALIVILLQMMLNLTNLDYVLKAVINTVSFRGISTLWFLPVLFLAECIYSVTKRKKFVSYFLVIVIPVIVIYISPVLIRMPVISTTDYIMFSVALVLIKTLTGYWFMECSVIFFKKFITLDIYKSIYILFFGSAVAIMLHDDSIDLNNLIFGICPILFFINGLILSFSIINIIRIINIKCKIIEKIGRGSLFIMCTHNPLFIAQAVSKLYRVILAGCINKFFVYSVYCILSVVTICFLELVALKIWEKIKDKTSLSFIHYC